MAKESKKSKIKFEKPTTDEEKQKVLEQAIAQIEKDFGKGAIMKLGEKNIIDVDVIPTGILTLDLALGVGGLPRSRIIEMYGPESSGKTTLALKVIAQAQKNGGICGFIDAEHALDPVYAKKLGVKIDELYITQPDNGEQGLEIAEMMVRSGAMDVIVIDSVAALVPKAEIDGTMTELQVGMHARMMSKALRKLTSIVGKSNCVVIFINQLREKIGVLFGSPEVTTGGRALKFYSSIRIDVRKIDSIKQGGKDSPVIGNTVKAKVVKNKVAAPFKEAVFDIIYGKGIVAESCLLDVAIELDIIKKSGSWYSYNGEKIGQGQEVAKQFIADNPEIAKNIEKIAKEKVLEGVNILPETKDEDQYVEDKEKDEQSDNFPNEEYEDLLGIDE